MTTNIILIIGLAFLSALIWYQSRRGKEEDGNKGLLFIQNQLNDLARILDNKIGQSSREMRESVKHQMTESLKLVKDVTEGLTKLEETNKNVLGFADQLQNLQDILKNPKQRGVLGEYYLETVLKNVMPPGSFEMQYKFENGETVDAAIFIKDKILPVDSKFSLENYNRLIKERDPAEKERLEKQFKNDLKLRIDETSKYIRPKENTMDFAFMFIPSEGIYYDILVGTVGVVSSRDLIEYAFQQKKVIIVSPTSFLAYLQTVLQGLRALQIEESAKGIRKNVEVLGRHVGAYESFMQRLGNSLGTTVNHYNLAHRELKKIDKDVTKITDNSPGIEPLEIGKPEQE
ncbi:DNA recombination protein RmuC [Candidatus Campbellbacteria bacterium CG11_big_fil_rev_8_21_14_0_20_44_21]|uniref:DNA recombination protein RmuC n=1 Tax=Candidatus Campbellbacteria bacterium CG22_combo_CG10-13_8_21_14_all_43_18 TaxID=1974530 RepID=A0A2H0DW55_9BACT|nr:MAG: DNA recombination protein RmuC [Candidatus Campbellbacteria bacterium CG22_combo_CG10-13_8_21_14_all_43_18]PIR24168.1 MAG: DNA recombination protein RmuC [Candidatus Campbellbacteria bacterium CG11_big_fil_rev_8_21_14_0_20_44_21]